ncbi:hypothetical protein BDZ45DRAFT_327839 [Acephala macrosclerotiorum]|nr:hypothetical protein BDZ45DRAFT_327839 [Acephala macrosclerotiorum]
MSADMLESNTNDFGRSSTLATSAASTRPPHSSRCLKVSTLWRVRPAVHISILILYVSLSLDEANNSKLVHATKPIKSRGLSCGTTSRPKASRLEAFRLRRAALLFVLSAFHRLHLPFFETD